MSARCTFDALGAVFEPPEPLRVAVLFLVFNRPDVTSRVFEAIRQARPPRLYIAADGPRLHRPGETEKCTQVRNIVSQVDWPCSVITLFRPNNLGCKRAVSSAIAWFFAKEEEGIILEDDCLPSRSFFWFCQDLLQRYRDDSRIWQICGTTYLTRELDRSDRASYFFSKYGPIWGWATWRRAWQSYDADLGKWPQMSEEINFCSVYPDRLERTARKDLGDRLSRGEIDTWDYQWGMAKNFQSGLSIVPAKNMIVNIGFGPEATHTRGTHPFASSQSFDVRFPLSHPPFVVADAIHDRLYRQKLVAQNTTQRAFAYLKRMVGRLTKIN
jgi:hypothetical protein